VGVLDGWMGWWRVVCKRHLKLKEEEEEEEIG